MPALAAWVCFYVIPYIRPRSFDLHITGKRHALNFHTLVPRATVVAVTSPEQHELDWAAENIDGVETYLDYEEMLAKADLQVVVVSSVTAAHATQALSAIKKGYHVLCEKPLSLDVGIVSHA